MGGSLGMALGRYGVARERWGYDHNMNATIEAKSRDAVDRTGELAQALADADLVILALPVRQTEIMLQQIAPFLSPGVVVTDVGSTKKNIVDAMEKWLPSDVFAVGGHPMAGSERAGIEAADPLLLENAVYLLTPGKGASPQAVQKIEKLVNAIKAHPVVLDVEKHDRLVALVSHLPHLLAVALVHTVNGSRSEKDLLLSLAGGGFRDTTRIAMGDASVWYDIFTTNTCYLREALHSFQEEIGSLWALLEKEQEEEARHSLERARNFRHSLPYPGKGMLPELFELIIMLPDVPGVIGKVATLVGEAGFNISEIEMLRNREDEGGSIRLAFSQLEERNGALEVLEKQGYRCWKKG